MGPEFIFENLRKTHHHAIVSQIITDGRGVE